MSLRKNENLTGWTLICLHFWAWLLNTIAITPKSEDKYVVKVFNPSEFHFSEVTFFQNWYFSQNQPSLSLQGPSGPRNPRFMRLSFPRPRQERTLIFWLRAFQTWPLHNLIQPQWGEIVSEGAVSFSDFYISTKYLVFSIFAKLLQK